MDAELDDQDGLYDSLPEMCVIPPALDQDLVTSSSINDGNSVSSSFGSEIPRKLERSTSEKMKFPMKRCQCRDRVQWVWEDNNQCAFVDLLNDNIDVKFHKHASNGTGIVRCTEPMTDDQYFWEIKMTYPVYGTDIMIGIGTSEAEVKDVEDKYISGLGMDNKSWGFSYTGLFHHNGERSCYATSFGQGSIIGIHLDLWRGTLSFYKDKKHLGVASTGLKGKTLYAMASSTAAKSGMRILQSCSFPSNLQFMCCVKLREIIPEDKNVLDVINIPPGLKHFLHSSLNWLLSAKTIESDLHSCSYQEIISDDDDDEVNDEADRHSRSIVGQYILLGSVLLSSFNRFQSAFSRLNEAETREESSLSSVKRRRH